MDERQTAEFVGEVTRHQRRLYAFIYSLIGRASDAEDVLQETNLVLWEKSGEFEPGTSFSSWAFRIAQFQVMAWRKKKQRSREQFHDELVAQLAEEAESRLQQFDLRRDALLECMKLLKPQQRADVAQRYEPGGSVNEMAQQSGRSPKAVSEALRRIREALLQCIEKRLALEGRT